MARLRSIFAFACVAALATTMPAPLVGQPPTYVDETALRWNAPAAVSTEDVEEKSYAWGDVDHDGDIDLVVARKQPWTVPGRRTNVLFLNEGGVLTDRTSTFAVDSDVPGDQGFLTPTCDRDIRLADLDGDGWLDIVTACALSDGTPKEISHPRIYRNLGSASGTWLGFRYEDARIPQLEGFAPSGFPHAPRFIEVAVGDIDADGDLDLYFTDHDLGGTQTWDFDDRLLINDGNGYFADATTTSFLGTAFFGYPFAVSWMGTAAVIADMDRDGMPDLVKQSALAAPLYTGIALNDPGTPGTFSEYAIPYTGAGYHVDVGDLNGDGWQDLVIADNGPDRYLLNQGFGSGVPTFSLESFSFVQGQDDGFSSDIVIADLDLDGFPEVLIADIDVDIPGCNRRLHLYHNQADPPNVTLLESGVQEPWKPNGVHDVAVFDVDGDAWPDLVIGTCAGTEVWIGVAPLPAFVRGDANADQNLDIADAVRILGFLFLGLAPLDCLDAADVNDDGSLDISDPLFVVARLFTGGSAIPVPNPGCGVDPTPDGLDCAIFAACP
ncbi:MAG: VCBS repeat-containing protein [Planctomycetes bacterium]|nr:VCBS repeat-containing protein [Planctomycetota bacterium]